MPIPTVVESEDQLPEGLGEYYEQGEDGTYTLAIEGVDSHPEVQGLKSSLQKQKQDREKLRKERDQFRERASLVPDDVDQETLEQALERIRSGEPDPDDKDKGGKGKGDDTDPAKVRQQIEKRYQSQLEEKDQAIHQRDQQVRQLVVDNGLTGALQQNGVTTPGLQKGAKRLLQDQVKVQEGDDGSLQAVVDTDMGEVSLEQFVKDWVSSEEGQDYLPKASGSGARGANGKGANGAKEMKREQFDQLESEERMKFIRNGGRLID